MNQFTAEEVSYETVSALAGIRKLKEPYDYGAYVGLDVRKETIVMSVARRGRGEPEFRGEFKNSKAAVRKQVE